MNKIIYKEGYVAFIDILGFSDYVLQEENAERINDLMVFVNKFKELFNTSPNLRTKVAFFSDSIVLSTEDEDNLGMLLMAIWIAESYLYKNTSLLFRGAISEGKYYNENNISFGPAVIKSYQLETKANYSRILIDENIIKKYDNISLDIFKDIDGCYCFNPYVVGLRGKTKDGLTPTKEEITYCFNIQKKNIEEIIIRNKNSIYVDKHLWRVRAFNKMCESLDKIFKSFDIDVTIQEKEYFNSQKIIVEEFLED